VLEYFNTEEFEKSAFMVHVDPAEKEKLLQTLRNESNEGKISFPPNSINGKSCSALKLWKITKAPLNFVPPGLILECEKPSEMHLLIPPPPPHRKDPKADLEKLREHLAELGCNPEDAYHVSPQAEVKNHKDVKAGNIALWWLHPEFKGWSQLSKLPIGKLDKNAVINQEKRFLCKRGSFLIVAPSGVGKSTLIMQMAICWAVGNDFFGLKPIKSLRCLVIQRENDDGDVAEMVQGIKAGLKLNQDQEVQLDHNLIVRTVYTLPRGQKFPDFLRDMIALHTPAVVFVDPLFAFLHGDFNSHLFATENFRHGIDPVLHDTGCIFVSAHHTPKPPRDPRAGILDHSYAGFGTSEMTNWYRAIATLRAEKGRPKTYRFIVAKRGNRAGFPNGQDYVLMQHSKTGLFWEPAEEIIKPAPPLKGADSQQIKSPRRDLALERHQKLVNLLPNAVTLKWPVKSAEIIDYIKVELSIGDRLAAKQLRKLKDEGVLIKKGSQLTRPPQ